MASPFKKSKNLKENNMVTQRNMRNRKYSYHVAHTYWYALKDCKTLLRPSIQIKDIIRT
jgi:hypothetical protein